MIDLDVLLAIAGFTATALVVVGMILVTPRGAVDTLDDVTDPQGSELSRADAIDPTHLGARPRPPAVHLGD
jgi:hypothetical protein